MADTLYNYFGNYIVYLMFGYMVGVLGNSDFTSPLAMKIMFSCYIGMYICFIAADRIWCFVKREKGILFCLKTTSICIISVTASAAFGYLVSQYALTL